MLFSLSFTGRISTSEWAQVVESVLRLDLPWRTLRQRLARLGADGNVEYASCFEDISPGEPIPPVTILIYIHYFCKVGRYDQNLFSTFELDFCFVFR